MSFLAKPLKYQALVSKKKTNTGKAVYKKAAEVNQHFINTFHRENGNLHFVDERI